MCMPHPPQGALRRAGPRSRGLRGPLLAAVLLALAGLLLAGCPNSDGDSGSRSRSSGGSSYGRY